MKRYFFLFLTIFLATPFAKADEVTHQLGNAAYAIRWARLEGANAKSPEHYRKAVELYRQAQIDFENRELKKAVLLSQESRTEARLALKEMGVLHE